jgi:hypothetical protein
MSATDVADLIAALRDGRLSLDEVVQRFQRRSWPVTRRPLAESYADLADQQDPEADMPGSFDDVTAAYDRGEITRAQYRALAHAVADAINGAAD